MKEMCLEGEKRVFYRKREVRNEFDLRLIVKYKTHLDGSKYLLRSVDC